MPFIYLCLDKDDVVNAIAVLDYEMVHNERIPWETADYTLVGKKYNREDGTLSIVPQPPEVRDITRLQFRQRFTLSEMAAIYAAENTDVVVKIILDDLRVAEFVDLNDPNTQNAVGYLYNTGYITYERMLKILE